MIGKAIVLVKISAICSHLSVLEYLCLKTPHGLGTQKRFEKLLIYGLRSHTNPIGDQHDVQYLSVFVNILYRLSLSLGKPVNKKDLRVF